MEKDAAKAFLDKYKKFISGEYSEQDRLAFIQWFQNLPHDEQEILLQEYTDMVKNLRAVMPADEAVLERIKMTIANGLTDSKRKLFVLRSSTIRKLSIAACIAGICLVTAYFYPWKTTLKGPDKVIVKLNNGPEDILPGEEKAVLILNDGTKVVLDSTANGLIAQQGSTSISNSDNGLLAYRSSGQTTKEMLYNTVSTPRGGQYKLELADGSKVWLNAASSLKFPTDFNADNRTVELSGEGYFEVAKNEHKPFNVKINGLSVRVLGTHFNVMGYDDEPAVKTTLLEGSVKIVEGNRSKYLTPGQQCSYIDGKDLTVIDNADIVEAMAWKSGLFKLSDAGLPTILRQIERWYDVHVKYEKEITGNKFNGTISRNMALSNVLKGIAASSGVRFRLEGKILIVY